LKGIGDVIDYGQHQMGKKLLLSCSETVLARRTVELTSHWHIIAGTVAMCEGQPTEAVRLLSIALQIAEDAGYQEGIARALLSVAVGVRLSDRPVLESELLLRKALQNDFTKNSPSILSRVLLNLVMVEVRKGQADEADQLLIEAKCSIQKSGNPILEAWLHKYEGFVSRLQCNSSAAAQQFSLASEVFLRLGNREEAERCADLKRRSTLSCDVDMLAMWGDARILYAQANKGLRELEEEVGQNAVLDQVPTATLLEHAHHWLADLECSANESLLTMNPATRESLERVRRELNRVDIQAPDAKLRIIRILQSGAYLDLESRVYDPVPSALMAEGGFA